MKLPFRCLLLAIVEMLYIFISGCVCVCECFLLSVECSSNGFEFLIAHFASATAPFYIKEGEKNTRI